MFPAGKMACFRIEREINDADRKKTESVSLFDNVVKPKCVYNNATLILETGTE